MRVCYLNIIMMIARCTESVNEGVINAAVNCPHMRPVNLKLLTLLTLSVIKILCLLCGVFVFI